MPEQAEEPRLPTYTPSGRVRWSRLTAALAIGLPAALSCGWLYAVLVSPAWHFVFRICAAVLAAVVASFVANSLLSRTCSRSPVFSQWAGALFGAAVVWV